MTLNAVNPPGLVALVVLLAADTARAVPVRYRESLTKAASARDDPEAGHVKTLRDTATETRDVSGGLVGGGEAGMRGLERVPRKAGSSCDVLDNRLSAIENWEKCESRWIDTQQLPKEWKKQYSGTGKNKEKAWNAAIAKKMQCRPCLRRSRTGTAPGGKDVLVRVNGEPYELRCTSNPSQMHGFLKGKRCPANEGWKVHRAPMPSGPFKNKRAKLDAFQDWSASQLVVQDWIDNARREGAPPKVRFDANNLRRNTALWQGPHSDPSNQPTRPRAHAMRRRRPPVSTAGDMVNLHDLGSDSSDSDYPDSDEEDYDPDEVSQVTEQWQPGLLAGPLRRRLKVHTYP